MKRKAVVENLFRKAIEALVDSVQVYEFHSMLCPSLQTSTCSTVYEENEEEHSSSSESDVDEEEWNNQSELDR